MKKKKQNMKRILLVLLYFVSFMECLKVTDFCHSNKESKEKKLECLGKYNLNCYGSLCTKYQNSCKNLILLRTLKNMHTYDKDFYEYKKKYDSFINQIDYCAAAAEPQKLNPNDYCLRRKNKYLSCTSTSARIWTINQLKQKDCKCIGKYGHRCNYDYCAKNKKSCDDLKISQINGIKEC